MRPAENAAVENAQVNRQAKVDMVMDVDWIRFARPRPVIDWDWQSQVREHPLSDSSLSDFNILKALGA